MNAAIIIIGDEILSGSTEDTNSRFLAAELRELGVPLKRVLTVPDELEAIAEAVSDFSARHDTVFTSGGIGPTPDDLTVEAVARAFNCRMVRHPELEEALRRHYGTRQAKSWLRMARVPDGAQLIWRRGSVIPVILMHNVYLLPGIPQLFRRCFAAISERFRGESPYSQEILVQDDEVNITPALEKTLTAFPQIQLGSYPSLNGYTMADATDSRLYRVRLLLTSHDGEAVRKASAFLLELLPGGTPVPGGRGGATDEEAP